MKRNSALMVVVIMMMALWMTMGSAYVAAAETCEGYDNKEEVPESGSGTFDVENSQGEVIGSITWDNDAEPENVSWSVDDGYSLEVCVKGGDATATGSGQSGTLTPPRNSGGETPDVSHFAWTVVVVGATDDETEDDNEDDNEDDKKVVEKDTEDDKTEDDKKDTEDDKTEDDKKVVEKDTEDDKQVVEKDADDDKDAAQNNPGVTEDDDEGDDVEVAVVDDGATAQVTQVPVGAASAGGGSTSGVENAQLFVVGSILFAAAGAVFLFARRVSRSA